DSRSAIILLLMPLVLVLVLGLALGESFGQTPDDRLRISIVNLDGGLPAYPNFPPKAWSEVVIDDLSATPDIRIESIADRAEGERLIAQGKRPAVIVFDPEFSAAMNRCSFLTKADSPPLNPLGRDGVRLRVIGVTLLKDPTQPVAASVIEQVIQVTMLRVVVPWMIGRAFEYLGKLPLVGSSITRTLQEVFSNYNFTAKTWARLTRSAARDGSDKNRESYADSDGSGLLKRGAIRYQVLVPSYTVMFAFFLVLTVGWLFVAERKHNTLIRLRFAPLGRSQILLGKLLPCLAVSLFQGFFLLIAGKLVFGMNWGADPWLLIPVAASTSIAAVGNRGTRRHGNQQPRVGAPVHPEYQFTGNQQEEALEQGDGQARQQFAEQNLAAAERGEAQADQRVVLPFRHEQPTDREHQEEREHHGVRRNEHLVADGAAFEQPGAVRIGVALAVFVGAIASGGSG